MTPQERLEQIEQTIGGLRDGWPIFLHEIETRIHGLTVQLINNDNEQTRGRIKALLELKDLPEMLQSEREGIRAELPETDSAN